MRLDHLLSREKAEVETLNAHSEVDTGPRGTVYKEGTHEVPKHVACVLPPVSFSGFVEKEMGLTWGFSSAGRAPALQAGGQRFDPANLHQHGLLAQLVRALA